jgi:ribonuclease H / adenosylcobalamin/alpha-ribazole phosphatase
VAAAGARRLVVEADGGSRGNPGPAAYGAVVRDADSGELLAELAESLGTATNNVAEYRGLLAGLRAARDIDPDAEVEARLDSKLVVEQMTGRWKIKNPDLRAIALAANKVLPPEQVRYTWVPRSRNAHADRLANEAMDAAERGIAWSPQPGPPAAVDEAEVEPAAQAVAGTLLGWAADLSQPTTLLLLRHGQTPYTLEKRFSGAGADPALTERGQWQADRAAVELAARGDIAAVVASPLRRATETAGIVASALGLDASVDDDLRECDFGDWDGRTFDEVRDGWPDELAAWLGSTAVAPPRGESFDTLARRVRDARNRILAANPGRSVLVVSHVTPIKVLVCLALGAPSSALYRMELDPASLTTMQWFADGNASMRAFNDTRHLR